MVAGRPAGGARSPRARATLEGAGQCTVTRLCGIYFFIVGAMFGYTVWLPQALETWVGAEPMRVCGVSAIAMAVAVGLASWIAVRSDRVRERRLHLALPSLVAAAGLMAAAVMPWPSASLVLVCVAGPGVMAFFGPFWSLAVSRLEREAAAGGIAYVNAMGNLGGFAAPYAAGVLKEWTHVASAPLVAMAVFSLLGALLVLATRDC